MNLLWRTLLAGFFGCWVASGAYASDYRIYCDPTGWMNSEPGTLVSARTTRIFNSDKADEEDLGPGPNLTGVDWSTLDYTNTGQLHGIVHGVAYDRGSFTEILDRVYHEALSEAELNALDDPPPSPFKVVATVSMENDDGKTATCDFEFRTSYLIYSDEPEEPLAIVSPDPVPVLKRDTALAPPGVTASAFPAYFFTDVGTNLRFVSAEFESTHYYDADRSGLFDGTLEVTAKTTEELEALGDDAPPNPFEVTVTLTVTNDEGFSATGAVTYETSW